MGETPSSAVSQTSTTNTFEIIDAPELARRWNIPTSWVREQCRSRIPAEQRIPHIRFGRYKRFRWNSPELNEFLNQRMSAPLASRLRRRRFPLTTRRDAK
jgi:hypothetical protein